MQDFEKLGAFYLGREFDLAAHRLKEEIVLYDSKDLTTHAVIIGMTGSGKTGLGISLLEEALIDNIPVIAIDPKGDLTNLLLGFPDLAPEDFRPWVNPQEALNKGVTPEQFARSQADTWRKGLADWGQSPDRIARLNGAADLAVYTPGSSAGLPISVLRSFSPPPAALLADSDLLGERIQTTATGLLALLGIEADPITSREHILLANIFHSAWSAGKSLDLAGLIRTIQAPPFDRIGVMDLASFYPAKERFALAMRLNNLLAAPGFESWLEGEPLDIGRLLYTPQGKPRASIFTISHLSDAQRMFFVSMLLNEILGWVRTQSGTSSLRAILYMDEIFGYFPPVQNPPSKAPLLSLLKQARAFGLGVVLATQNPVDLDYKGLANTGTWFIGRLQTEQDRDRVLAGLQGAAADRHLDRGQLTKILSGLERRVFLLHNVHETQPVLFQTRWALTYLRGPMTRDQIKTLMADRKTAPAEAPSTAEKAPAVPAAPGRPAVRPSPTEQGPPVVPPGIDTFFMAASGAGQGLVYVPAVIGRMDIRYANTRYQVDTRKTAAYASQLAEGPVVLDWDNAKEIDFDPGALDREPLPGSEFADLPTTAQNSKTYPKWSKDLLRWVRQNRALVLYRCDSLKLSSSPEESESVFRARLAQAAREQRDLEVEKLRRKYSRKFTTLKDRLMRAEQAIAREQEQAKSRKVETMISFGSAILGAFLGRKAVSAMSTYRVGTAMKSAGRIGKETMDVARAQETAAAVRLQLEELEGRLQEDIGQIEDTFDPAAVELAEIRLTPKSSDLTLEVFGLAWMPYRRDAEGRLTPDWG